MTLIVKLKPSFWMNFEYIDCIPALSGNNGQLCDKRPRSYNSVTYVGTINVKSYFIRNREQRILWPKVLFCWSIINALILVRNVGVDCSQRHRHKFNHNVNHKFAWLKNCYRRNLIMCTALPLTYLISR